MTSTRPRLAPQAPLLALAANDNHARPHEAGGSSRDRARVALSAPLRRPGEAPPPAARRFHTIRGERVLSSTLAIEHHGAAPRWRASATLWGTPSRERRDVAALLAQHLVLALGEGPIELEVNPSTVFARRALTAAERALLASTTIALAADPRAAQACSNVSRRP